jgi:hypothetical protein
MDSLSLGGTEFWIGYYQSDKSNEPSGNWCSVDSCIDTYVPWAQGEPSNGDGIQDCAKVYRSGGGDNTWFFG